MHCYAYETGLNPNKFVIWVKNIYVLKCFLWNFGGKFKQLFHSYNINNYANKNTINIVGPESGIEPTPSTKRKGK